MADLCRRSLRDARLALQKSQEAACRRFQAAEWVESVSGPTGLPLQPSECEFVACLRSGVVLCNVANRVHPGAVPKVVGNLTVREGMDSQPPPVYQYFENVRNFLVAMKELKVPSFEASDLERETIEAGSVAKIVDCILALKYYHEKRQISGDSGLERYVKSPRAIRSVAGITFCSTAPCKQLDLSTGSEKQQKELPKCGDMANLLANVLADFMSSSKENVNQNLLDSWQSGKLDSIRLFDYILSSCLHEEQSYSSDAKPCCKLCLRKGDDCHNWNLLEAQESKILELKTLLQSTRVDFISLQSHLQNEVKELATHIQGLSDAAASYHQAIKENRSLHNMLQELKGNIRVFCRIRPTLDLEAKSSIDYIGNDGSLMVFDPLKPQNTRKVYQFNKVFGPSVSQDEVYKETQCLIRSVMDGYNVCIFAYGQTGSGKTHTMCGPSSQSAKEMGINYLALNDLFQVSCTRKEVKYDIQVQMVEIYNEQVRDLLTNDASQTKLEIRNCSNSGPSLPGADMHLVHSTSDVLNLMKQGEKNRVSGSTNMNQNSSRSHSVLIVHVHGRDFSGSITNSCLHLVDLAGSERVDKSEATGDRLKEAQHINKSLSCLGDVITALAQKHSHIPYRNSKLTQLLQNSLGGHAKMLMFAHLSPEAEYFGETLSTLKFAQRVSTVELGAAVVNKESTDVRELKEQIDGLKKALASKEAEKTRYSMKENAAPFERSRHETEYTSPRPRRLSIGNSNTSKCRMTSNTNDRKELKSPLSRPIFATEDGTVRLRRLSLEDAKCGRNLKGAESSTSTIHTNALEGVSKEENIKSPEITLKDDPDAKASFSSTARSSVISIQNLGHLSPNACNSSYETRIPEIDCRYKELNQKTETTYCSTNVEERVISEVTSLSNKSQTRSYNTNTNSRGQQLTKSSQPIGKTNNGYDKRNYHAPSETTSSKIGRGINIDSKSPLSDAKSRQKQSFKNFQPSANVSRRASLGGSVALKEYSDANASSKDTTCGRTFTNQNSSHITTSGWDSSYKSQLPKIESRYRVPSQQSEATYSSRKVENVVTSDETSFNNKSDNKISDTSTKSRRLHIRKSLHTIGKFINGSDHRNCRAPSQAPSSTISMSIDIDIKSPTSDARSRRRQSLTNIQPSVNVSRRASLGGLPDSVDKSVPKTQTKSKRLWL